MQGDSLSLSRAADLFMSRHASFSVDDHSGWAPVFRPKQQTACDAVLRRRIPTALSGPAYEVFWRIARFASPATVPEAPPATVCAGCNAGAPLNNAVQVAVTGQQSP